MCPSGFVERARLASLLTLTACGDPLADGTYPGSPLFQISGTVYADASQAPPIEGVQVTLLWGPNDEGSWQESLGLNTTFPSRFELTLYAPPPTDLMSPLGAGLGVGSPVLYTDDDHDGVFDRDRDTLVGGSEDKLVLYVGDEAEITDTGSQWAAELGYHMVQLTEGDCLSTLEAAEETDPQSVDLFLSTQSASPLVGCAETDEPPRRPGIRSPRLAPPA